MKSNIGHLEGASALAGVIKAILVLENGIIPPNANFEHLNPKIDEKELGLKVSWFLDSVIQHPLTNMETNSSRWNVTTGLL